MVYGDWLVRICKVRIRQKIASFLTQELMQLMNTKEESLSQSKYTERRDLPKNDVGVYFKSLHLMLGVRRFELPTP